MINKISEKTLKIVWEDNVKPSPFRYIQAATLHDVHEAFARHGDDAKLLAGGQSLLAAMNMRLAAAEVLIDINHIEDLHGIDVVDGVLRIGALCRHADVLTSALVAKHAPVISRAMPHIAHPTVRNRGSFGGSLCHCDPASELPACAVASGARMNIEGPNGSRTVEAADFVLGTYTTCLEHDEVLVSVDVPLASDGTRVFFDEVARRKGDYAMAGLAAQSTLVDGVLTDTRLVFFGVGEMALEAKTAQSLLNGSAPGRVDIDTVCDCLATDIEPFADLTTSVEAKMHLMTVLTRRAAGASGEGFDTR